ncbi:MAG TPA: hypothetical protein VFQ15_01400, partial [Jiangellaceae bacterium]|nr:hypothetical protein [Jiangellaceae bacterium]
MTSTQGAVDVAGIAAEAVRELNHRTLGPHALTGPAELDRIVAELAIMAARLPQLLRQLGGWLHAEQGAGRVRSDNSTDPARIVARAAAELDTAGHAAHELGHALDDAHQHLAHLGAGRPGRTTSARAAVAPPPVEGRAETVATSGQCHGHQRAGSVAVSGQDQMSLDIRPG